MLSLTDGATQVAADGFQFLRAENDNYNQKKEHELPNAYTHFAFPQKFKVMVESRKTSATQFYTIAPTALWGY